MPTDNERAAEELEQLKEAVLDDWILVTTRATQTARAMQETLSWRVTKPLRLARIVQRKSTEIGVMSTLQLSAAALAARLGR